MPYRKTYKKKQYRRPGYKSCGKMVWGDAKKALTIASNLKRLVNVEVKNFDVQQQGVALSTTPVIIQLSNIPQGDTTISRDGAQCKVLALELALQMTRHSSSTITTARILLVCDRQTNQAIYLNTDLLEDVTTNDNLVAPYNLDNKFRFTVIMDKVFNLATGSSGVKHFKKVFRMNKIIRFDGNTPSIADLTSSSLSLIQFANESTNTPLITMFSRIRFVDN